MPEVTVTYFDFKAVAEGIRLLLAYNGQEFTDKRVSFEEWPELKPKTPFGGLPLLEIDGKTYATCLAIYRYLGKKYGLNGDNDEEAFEIDQNVDYLYDLRLRGSLVFWEADEEIKEKKHAEYSKLYPTMLEKLNNIIEKNGIHLAAGKLTWADFHLAGLFDYLKKVLRIPDLETQYPAIKKLTDKVYALPQLKSYLETARKVEW